MGVYTYSVIFGEIQLLEGCREFFRKEVKPIEETLESPSFLTIPYEVLLDLLKINDSNANRPWDLPKLGVLISDKELFSACHKWAVAECKRQEIEPSGLNKRKVLGESFTLIRFPCMLDSDIKNLVLPTDILTEDQKAYLHESSATMEAQTFLSTKQHFPVEIRSEMKTVANRVVCRRTDSNTEHESQSTLKLTPHKRLELSQIWVVTRYYGRRTLGRQSSRYEVVIISKNHFKNRQSVVSKVIGSFFHPIMSFLDLEPIVLDADCSYTITVHYKERQDHDPRIKLSWKAKDSLHSKIRVPADVDLEITREKRNAWISALTVRLV